MNEITDLELRGLEKLVHLDVSYSKRTDKGLKTLPRTLIYLNLTNTNITDKGVEYLILSNKGLTHLSLAGTQIKNSTLLLLSSLTHLDVRATDITITDQFSHFNLPDFFFRNRFLCYGTQGIGQEHRKLYNE